MVELGSKCKLDYPNLWPVWICVLGLKTQKNISPQIVELAFMLKFALGDVFKRDS